jgi:Flp pilus assembly protein TadD
VARLLAVAAGIVALGATAVPGPLVEAVRAAREAESAEDDLGAARAYHSAYRYQPWVDAWLVAAVEAELRAGRDGDAERDLATLAAGRPLEAREMAWLGAIYAGRGEINRAVQTWEQARALGTVDTDTLARLAGIYETRREWPQAVTVLRGLIQLDPSNAALYYQIGVILSLDAPEEALVALAEAVALDPARGERLAPLQASLEEQADQTPDLAYARLGIILVTLEEYPLAEEALSRAVAHNRAYAEPLAYLAYVRARLGEPALGAAQQAVALAPDSPTVRYLAGLTWKQLNRPAEARVEFEAAYDLDPSNPAICVEIASTHRADASLEWAEIWMQEAVRLAPDDARFRLLLVQFYVDEEYKIAEAGLPLAEELVADMPGSAEAHDALAWAYFLTGDAERAQAELDRAVALDATLGRAYAHLGVLMEQQGRPSQALWYYLHASELEPEGPFGALARRAIERLGGG